MSEEMNDVLAIGTQLLCQVVIVLLSYLKEGNSMVKMPQ